MIGNDTIGNDKSYTILIISLPAAMPNSEALQMIFINICLAIIGSD